MNSGSEIVRIGVIGAGHVTETLHLPVLAAMPDVKLVWVCDVDKARADKLARFHRIGEVRETVASCSDVDIVLIATPVGLRDKVLEHVFTRRWHAFVEKPFATSSKQHEWILRCATQAGVQVGVGFQRRMYHGTILAQQIVARSLFGPIKQIWATEGMRLGRSRPGGASWSVDSKIAGGGVFTETACHIIDQVLTVCAPTDWQLDSCEIRYCRNIDFEAKVMGSLALADRQRCKFGIAVSWFGDLYNAIVIEFATVQLRIGIADGKLEIGDPDGDAIAGVDSLCATGADRSVFQPYYDEWREFIGQSIGWRPSRVNADTARSTTRFIEQCYRRYPPPMPN